MQNEPDVVRTALGVATPSTGPDGRACFVLRVDALAAADDAARQGFARRLRSFSEVATRIGVEEIVATVSVAVDDAGVTVEQEAPPGAPLSAHLTSDRALDGEEAVVCIARAAEALERIHREGEVHGGLHPALLYRVGTPVSVRILGCGILPALVETGAAATWVEGRGVRYLAPELLRGAGPGPASDQFSLAAILFELLCGVPAFGGEEASSVLYRVVHEDPANPDRAPRPIAGPLRDVLSRALAKEPAARFPDAGAFGSALREALARVGHASLPSPAPAPPEAPEAPRTSRPEPPRTRPRRRLWPWFVAVGALAAAAAAILFRGELSLPVPGPAEEVWWETTVRAEPRSAELAYDGIPIGDGEAVRFRPEGPFGTVTARLACREAERRVGPEDAGGEVVLVLDPTSMELDFDPGPRGATVRLNGEAPLETPTRLTLDLCRENRLAVAAEGFRPAELSLAAGMLPAAVRAASAGLALDEIPIGRIEIPRVPGVKLVWYVDGRRLGADEQEVEVEAGTHRVRYKNEYHWLDRTVRIDVPGGEGVAPDVDARLGTLVVQAFPSNCKVSLKRSDGSWQALGETPFERSLAPGAYEVEVVLNSTGQKETRAVELRAGDNPPVRVSFPRSR